jgi:tRNA(fMet)-specific endonuclease VapC
VTLSLDTNVIVDIAQGRPAVRQRFLSASTRGEEMVISVIVWHELMLGVRLVDDPSRELAKIERVLRGVSRMDFTLEDAEAVAALRARLRPQGREIGAYDSLIAGQALARGWTLVTANTRESDRVDGLRVVDWSRPEEE